MTLQERLDKAHQLSVTLYLRGNDLEAQRQAIVQSQQQVQLELVRLDGDIRTLTELIADVKPSGE